MRKVGGQQREAKRGRRLGVVLGVRVSIVLAGTVLDNLREFREEDLAVS